VAYRCNDPEKDFKIEFNRQKAYLLSGDERTEMQFVSSDGFDDRFEGGGYTLTLDLEAILTEPSGKSGDRVTASWRPHTANNRPK
jgi:hypothetical protein